MLTLKEEVSSASSWWWSSVALRLRAMRRGKRHKLRNWNVNAMREWQNRLRSIGRISATRRESIRLSEEKRKPRGEALTSRYVQRCLT